MAIQKSETVWVQTSWLVSSGLSITFIKIKYI
jgi:hypothetical protein